jgi:hypothetical protein
VQTKGDPIPSAEGAPPLDLTKLPPIESITAETDIRAFLAPGVPAELTRAALRRAWVADPAIREFVGIAENQWDFTAPQGTPGFGPLEMTDELRRLAERIVGGEESVTSPPSTATEPAHEESRPSAAAAADHAEDAAHPPTTPPAETRLASAEHADDAPPAPPRPRRSGGALSR